jgi:predicted ribosomally synthesized peptide with nif11-like leader
MSRESASKFFEKLQSDSELLGRVKETETVDEIRAIAKDGGFDFTEDEYLAVASQPIGDGELSDEQLDEVAGGLGEPGGPLAPATKLSSCYLTIPPGCAKQARKL